MLVCCVSLSVGFRLPARARMLPARLQVPRLRDAAGPTQEDIAAEKLVYDTKSGRFFESSLDDIAAEEFCLLDSETGQPILLTRDEKERIFLDAIQSYYFSGKSGLPDDQFDRLKEDLSWEGSALVALNRDESLFMNAMQAYNKGKPIITDAQFDELKTKLKESGSKVRPGPGPGPPGPPGKCPSWPASAHIQAHQPALPPLHLSTSPLPARGGCRTQVLRRHGRVQGVVGPGQAAHRVTVRARDGHLRRHLHGRRVRASGGTGRDAEPRIGLAVRRTHHQQRVQGRDGKRPF